MKSFRECRLDKGISQVAVANKCGVSRQTIINWEVNPEQMPVGKWEIIAQMLGVDVSFIFGL